MEGGYKLNITKAIVVAIYIIVGAALGVIIIPEVVTDLGIHHHAVITNYYVAVSYTHLTLPTKA